MEPRHLCHRDAHCTGSRLSTVRVHTHTGVHARMRACSQVPFSDFTNPCALMFHIGRFEEPPDLPEGMVLFSCSHTLPRLQASLMLSLSSSIVGCCRCVAAIRGGDMKQVSRPRHRPSYTPACNPTQPCVPLPQICSHCPSSRHTRMHLHVQDARTHAHTHTRTHAHTGSDRSCAACERRYK